jgi:hypothetical protein
VCPSPRTGRRDPLLFPCSTAHGPSLAPVGGQRRLGVPAAGFWITGCLKANKMELSPRGRIPRGVVDQFRAAGN